MICYKITIPTDYSVLGGIKPSAAIRNVHICKCAKLKWNTGFRPFLYLAKLGWVLLQTMKYECMKHAPILDWSSVELTAEWTAVSSTTSEPVSAQTCARSWCTGGKTLQKLKMMCLYPYSAKLACPWATTNKKSRRTGEKYGRTIKASSYVIIFETLKSCQKCIFGPVKHAKFLRVSSLLISEETYISHALLIHLEFLLLTWSNFNPSMD